MESQTESKRPSRYIRDLSQLPRGVFHQVLDDLPLIQVMKILSFRNQYLQECILSHRLYGNFFTTDKDVDKALELFTLLRDVYGSRYSSVHISFYMFRSGYFNWTEPPRAVYSQDALLTFCARMGNAIQNRLELTAIDYQLLLPYGPASLVPKLGRIYNNYSNLLAAYKWTKEAKANLNMAKSQQLEMAADLVVDYPGKLMLKKPLDPSQDGPRRNMEHIEMCLRGLSKKVLKDRKFSHERFQQKCNASADLIQLIPYDKYLWIFLETLSSYPLRDHHSTTSQLKSTLDEQVEELSHPLADFALSDNAMTSNKIPNTNNTPIFSYPGKIESDIKTVLKGLMHVYTGSGLLIIPRIDWDQEKPIFDKNDRRHRAVNELPVGVHRCPVAKTMPHDEREYEWLKAFLRAVTWMDENLNVQVDEKSVIGRLEVLDIKSDLGL